MGSQCDASMTILKRGAIARNVFAQEPVEIRTGDEETEQKKSPLVKAG